MVLNKDFYLKIFIFLKVIFIAVWLSNLSSTDAYISVYVMIALAAFYAVLQNFEFSFSKKEHLIIQICSVFFSGLVLIANYPLFTRVRDLAYIQSSTNLLVNILNSFFSFVGGSIVGYSILSFLYGKVKSQGVCFPRSSGSKNYLFFFVLTFFSIFFVNIIHLFFVEYPGNLTEDTFTQIGEMVTGRYSNFNTFWHTVFVQGFLKFGYALSGDLNGSVAFYCVVQSLILSFAFSYCLSTLYLLGVPVFFLICSFFIYGILPYNIALSITIWKDVLFSAGCLLFICSVFRIIYKIGRWNFTAYLFLIIGGFLFALSRNNGWYVFFATVCIFVWPLRKYWKLIIAMISVFIVCWFMTNPLLSMLNVSGGDYTESLSIPLQQISRVIAEGCELTEEETELISQVLDIEEVPSLYTNWLSDPIKIEFRSNNTAYFEENVGQYISLWFRLGVKYPGEYLKAWVDQTKGYWNAGYGYGMYSETVTDNPYGVEKTANNNIIAVLFRIYFGLSRHVIFFEPLHSIGLHVWITALCCLFNAMQKRKEWLLSVPLLVLVLGLCAGTPVYASFRYAYPVFVCFPLIVGTAFYKTSEETTCE